MVLAPNDLFSWDNKYNKYNEYNVTDTFTCFFLSYSRQLILCMLASWSHEGVVFLDLLSSSYSITSSLFLYLGSTDAPCSRLGDPFPSSPKWRPHSQGPRTLPYRDPEQLPFIVCRPRKTNFHFSFCSKVSKQKFRVSLLYLQQTNRCRHFQLVLFPMGAAAPAYTYIITTHSLALFYAIPSAPSLP